MNAGMVLSGNESLTQIPFRSCEVCGTNWLPLYQCSHIVILAAMKLQFVCVSRSCKKQGGNWQPQRHCWPSAWLWWPHYQGVLEAAGRTSEQVCTYARRCGRLTVETLLAKRMAVVSLPRRA
eukprot:1145324-Pelagomonas_calceolata.AAC.1